MSITFLRDLLCPIEYDYIKWDRSYKLWFVKIYCVQNFSNPNRTNMCKIYLKNEE